jgi:hypothetical protein
MTSQAVKVYEVLKGYYKKYSELPKFNYIEHHTGFNKAKIANYMKELEAEGLLNRNYAKYSVPENSILEEEQKKTIIKSEEKNVKFLMNPFFYFRIIIMIVFISFLYIGIKYNYVGYSNGTSFSFDALIKSVGFILFGVISFHYGLEFWGKHKILSVVLFFLFSIIFATNFFNIFNGQFENYEKFIYSEKNITVKNNSNLQDSYEKQILSLEKKIKLHYDFIEEHKSTEDKYWQVWTATNKKIPEIEKEIKILNDKLEKMYVDNVSVEENRTVFTFISSIFNKDKRFSDTIQLIYLLFPGLIVEIVLNVSLSLLFVTKLGLNKDEK